MLSHDDRLATPGAEDASAVRGTGASVPIVSAARGAGDSEPITSAARGADDANSDESLWQPEDPAPPAEPAGELAAEPKKERGLRIDALSLEHCLAHRPENSYCEVCARARAKQVYHRKGAFLVRPRSGETS